MNRRDIPCFDPEPARNLVRVPDPRTKSKIATVTAMSADADAPPPTPRAHVSSLDGLRGLAVASVMAVHAGVPGFDLGFLGVDLFFVLSGFLITSLLDREHRRAGRVDLGKFWGRRFLRLMPAYYLYVGGLTLAFAAFGWGWREPHGGWTPGGYIASLWFYYVN